MGTKVGLHSSAFLQTLIRRQLLLSAGCAAALTVAAGLVVFADTANIHPYGAASWWATILVSVGAPVALGIWYVVRAPDLEDEALGLLDVATLPPRFTVPLPDDPLRGD